jgi:hypothetical protein
VRLKFHLFVFFISSHYNIIEQLKLYAYMTHAEIQCGLKQNICNNYAYAIVSMHVPWYTFSVYTPLL